MGCFVRGGKNGMGCFVWGDKNCMGCFVRGDKNCMGCFVRGGKLMRDVLSGVAKNGMGCFVPGCFVLHSRHAPNTCQCVPNVSAVNTPSNVFLVRNISQILRTFLLSLPDVLLSLIWV